MNSSAMSAEVSTDFQTSLAWDLDHSPDDWRVDALTQESKIKVFWWNTGCGLLNRIMIKDYKQPDSLYTNINTLARAETRPDILILGEHCPGQIPKETKNLLKKIYGYDYNLEHSNPSETTRNGIWVFSKWPMSLQRKKAMEVGDTKAEKKLTARFYLLFKIESPDKTFYLSPVHIYNSWKNKNIFEVGFGSLFEDNNNYKQIAVHLDYLKEDLDLSKDAVIVIGDFNSAKNFVPFFSMAGYNLYAKNLVDVGVNEATYPTRTSKLDGNGYPDVHIDHIFSNAFKDGKSVMLPLKGSDHYPIIFNY